MAPIISSIPARKVAFPNGFYWFKNGFRLVLLSPWGWFKCALIYGFFGIGTNIIPVIGPLVFTLISPALLAGLMLGCQEIEQERSIRLDHLFYGFQKKPVIPFLVLGSYNVAGTFFIVLVLAFGLGNQVEALKELSQQTNADPHALLQLIQKQSWLWILVLLLETLLSMFFWFAPALLFFKGCTPKQALLSSAVACFHNTLPFLLNMLLFIITACLILGIGLLISAYTWIILVPFLFSWYTASVYASFRDLFDQ